MARWRSSDSSQEQVGLRAYLRSFRKWLARWTMSIAFLQSVVDLFVFLLLLLQTVLITFLSWTAALINGTRKVVHGIVALGRRILDKVGLHRYLPCLTWFRASALLRLVCRPVQYGLYVGLSPFSRELQPMDWLFLGPPLLMYWIISTGVCIVSCLGWGWVEACVLFLVIEQILWMMGNSAFWMALPANEQYGLRVWGGFGVPTLINLTLAALLYAYMFTTFHLPTNDPQVNTLFADEEEAEEGPLARKYLQYKLRERQALSQPRVAEGELVEGSEGEFIEGGSLQVGEPSLDFDCESSLELDASAPRNTEVWERYQDFPGTDVANSSAEPLIQHENLMAFPAEESPPSSSREAAQRFSPLRDGEQYPLTCATSDDFIRHFCLFETNDMVRSKKENLVSYYDLLFTYMVNYASKLDTVHLLKLLLDLQPDLRQRIMKEIIFQPYEKLQDILLEIFKACPIDLSDNILDLLSHETAQDFWSLADHDDKRERIHFYIARLWTWENTLDGCRPPFRVSGHQAVPVARDRAYLEDVPTFDLHRLSSSPREARVASFWSVILCSIDLALSVGVVITQRETLWWARSISVLLFPGPVLLLIASVLCLWPFLRSNKSTIQISVKLCRGALSFGLGLRFLGNYCSVAHIIIVATSPEDQGSETWDDDPVFFYLCSCMQLVLQLIVTRSARKIDDTIGRSRNWYTRWWLLLCTWWMLLHDPTQLELIYQWCCEYVEGRPTMN